MKNKQIILAERLLNIENKILIQSITKFGPTHEATVWAREELKKLVPDIVKQSLKLGVILMRGDT